MQRAKESDRSILCRPKQSNRFVTAEQFVQRGSGARSHQQPGQLQQQTAAWMVKRYFELYGYEITKKKIRNGLMVEIRAYEESVCHIAGISSDQEKQQARSTLSARMKAWEVLFQSGGLGLHEDLFKIINPKTFNQSDKRLAKFIL